MPSLKINLLYGCVAMCMGAGSSFTWAAESDSESTVQLPTIKVEATRTDTTYMETPASIFRVDIPKNDQSAQVNLTEVVKGIPSVQLRNRENYAQDLQLSMRGFGARSTFGVRGIRLYTDGIPATMPDGQGQTSNIDLGSLSHLEVLTGPFSSLYGNSSGGAILATTREGQGKDSIEMSYAGGSHNKNRAGIVLQGGAKNQNEPSYIVSSSYFDTDGYRDHSGANKVLSNAKLTWNLDDGSKINWVTNYVKIDADDPGGLTRADWEKNPKQVAKNVLDYNARKTIDQTQTGLTWSKPINDQNELYAMTYIGQRQVTQYQSIPDTVQKNPNTPYQAGGVIDFKRDYYGADFRWTGKDLLPNTQFSAGVAIDAMNEDRQGYLNFNDAGDKGIKGAVRRDERNTLWNVDPYLQASWSFLPTMRLDTGVRYSNVHYKSKDHYIVGLNGDNSGKTTYEEVLPSVALSWQIIPEVLAYASYAKGFETPTFTEMAYPAQGGASTLDLKPSKSDNYELGLKSSNTLGDFNLATFYIETKDDIVAAESMGGRATFRNADKTLRKGVEFAWNKKLWKDLAVNASYAYLDATFDSKVPAVGKVAEIPEGNAIPGIAKNQAFIGLAWQPEQGFYAGLDTQFMDKVYVNDINSDVAASYTVASIYTGYAWKRADWGINGFARVDNLFDKNYAGSVIVNEGSSRFFEPADGRNWSAGIKVSKQF
ncbi:putative tonB-dependent receptor yncD precursor [Acinetobacter sp. neg1]|uniref:TonB-dependent receptor n=1 Tax=Acinetobacter TaxID=469 RepID=UPI0005426D1A|nr:MULTISPECIES: TonB-dependent receptor [Acinetobacter]KHF77602.1 putative tonB-dependent receptor yncD precursor [Acinetobacter sp. neg1]KYQ85425.1 TonB-dependent receptor [Acinetobacter sp. NRRL B-65365]MBJ8483944.1 TonB-dependent receptor [Acinetobacter vivianii]